MTLIGDKRSQETAERVARQKELAKVAIKKEDVELIVSRPEGRVLGAERIILTKTQSIFRCKSWKFRERKPN